MPDDKLAVLLDRIESNAEGGCVTAPGECVPGENACTYCEALTMVKALRAVLELHHPEDWVEWDQACPAHADAWNQMRLPPVPDCPGCKVITGTGCEAETCVAIGADWPCPTVQPIIAALTGEEKADA